MSSELASSSTLPHLTIRYRVIKIVSLLKLLTRNVTNEALARSEIDDIGAFNSPSNLYESYPDLYPGRSGSIIPFSLRLLQCEVQYLADKNFSHFFKLYHECMTKLKSFPTQPNHAPHMNATDEEILSGTMPLIPNSDLFIEFDESSPLVWQNRADSIIFSIVSRQAQIREYRLALQTLKTHMKHMTRHPQFIGLVIRLQLLLGNISGARRILSTLETIVPKDSIIYLEQEGMIFVSESEYEKGLANFEAILKQEPYRMTSVNNAAICHTFLCRASKAVSLLEDSLFSRPQTNIIETSIFNLCTLYEILGDRYMSRRRKILQLMLDHAPDHFNLLCLRLP